MTRSHIPNIYQILTVAHMFGQTMPPTHHNFCIQVIDLQLTEVVSQDSVRRDNRLKWEEWGVYQLRISWDLEESLNP